MNKICHLCKQPTDLIVQSTNLQYWYCRDCKVEPIDLPPERDPYDDFHHEEWGGINDRMDSMYGKDNVESHRWTDEYGYEVYITGIGWVKV